MAEQIGRKVSISVDGNVVATARTKTLTINNSSVNVTSDGDDGVQRLLSESGETSVEMSVEGIFDTDAPEMMESALGGAPLVSIVLTYPTFTLTGQYKQTSFSSGLPYNEATTFTAAYSSSGAVVKANV